jgi:hypothetical protein
MIFKINLLFLPSKLKIMEHEEVIDNKGKDVGYSWVLTSRFLFYCQVAILVAIIIGGCYTFYVHRYTGKPQVEVPGNTQYNPQYK